MIQKILVIEKKVKGKILHLKPKPALNDSK